MVHDQLELAEVRAPEDVGDGLAADPAAHHARRSAAPLRRAHARVGVQRRPVEADHRGEQHLCVQLRRVDAGPLEGLGRLGQRIAQR